MAVEAKFRRVHFGSLRAYLIGTKPVSDIVDDEHSDEAEDWYFGRAVRMRVKTVFGDYLRCWKWDGATLVETDILVAKPPELRHSLVGPQSINGVDVSYSYGISGGVCSRVASGGGQPIQTEWVVPIYFMSTGQDSEIWADRPEGGTGVSAAPVWMDTNRGGRRWVEVD